MRLPEPRGPISAGVITALCIDEPVNKHLIYQERDAIARVADPLTDADFQLALAVCYQLHYTGFDGPSAPLPPQPTSPMLSRASGQS